MDAVCIDQGNNEEKAHQIALMRDIYHCARRTAVWLGAADQSSDIAFGYARTLATQGTSAVGAEEEAGGRLDPVQRRETALKDVLCREWFNRIWIVQEVSVSKDVVVQCGEHVVSWAELSAAATLMEKGERQNYYNLMRQREEFASGMQMELLALVMRHQSQKATDPRDKIYALLGLARQDCPPGLTVSYNVAAKNIF